MLAFSRMAAFLGVLTISAGSSAYADACDYKPSRILEKATTSGAAATATAAAVGSGVATTAGVGMKAAGFYTLVHAGSGLTMLGSTAAGASAAGTVGIIGGTGGAVGAIGSFLMAPATIAVGALTLAIGGGFEGVCYFFVDRVTDPYQVREIIENVSRNDPAVSITTMESGDAMVIATSEGEETYLLRKLYIADGNLMHRDWGPNTNLGPVLFTPVNAAE